MITFTSRELKLNFVHELGIDRIKKASPQKTYCHKKIQLTFMDGGELLWKFPGGRKIHLRGGEFCLTQDGDSFSVGHDVLAPCNLVWLIFDPFAPGAGKGSFFSEKELRSMGKILVNAGNPVRRASPQMLFYFREILELLSSPEKNKPDFNALNRLRLYINGIFIESVSMFSGTSFQFPALQSNIGAKVKNLVLGRPSHNFSIEEIAGHFKLSAGLFGRKFKKECGMSLADFVRRAKFDEALRRLNETSSSITEISFALGFSSSQYFATVFKRYFGKPPKQFRKSAS